MSDRITDVLPTPRPVTIGGASYAVWPATLRDVAELQQWLDGSWPDPLAEVWPSLFGPESLSGEPRWAVLREAYAKAIEGPPAWDDDRGAERLASPEGVAVMLWLALKKGQPGLPPESVAKMALTLAESEYFAVRRAWLGTEASHELAILLLEGFPVRRRKGPGVTWAIAIHETAEAFGWTYPQVYEMTLVEFANARRGGKPAPGPLAERPGSAADYAEFMARINGPAAGASSPPE